MEDQNYPYQDWDDSVFATGRTEPPKSHGGLIAFMLILIIFLCGIVTVLGVLNIKLFKELQVQKEDISLSFVQETEAPQEVVPEPLAETEAPAQTFTSIDLHQSPKGQDNLPPEGGMSLQDIYAGNIGSVASILCSRQNGNSTGTGVILSQDGYIVTNAHVVEGAGSITVQLSDDRVFAGSMVGCDEISDLAVLKIPAKDLPPAQFGSSADLRVGDTVVAIGDPLGVEFRGSYTDGIISAINRDVDVDGRIMTLIQTNAALNSGNSGGPLINCYGQVIGINTMKIGAFTDSAGVEGLGFAIPSATVKEIVDQLISQGYVSGRPTLGITGDTLSPFYQHYYRLPAGVFITDVARGTDAWSKGLKEGDILMSIDETRITNLEELKAAIAGYEVGQTVQTIIFRSGQQYLVELILAEDKG